MKRSKVTLPPGFRFDTGSTMLNMACSDDPFGAFLPGSIVTIPGESAAGKTVLILTILAEAAANPVLKNYELIMDDAEHAMDFDIPKLFPPLVGRMIPPDTDKKGNPKHSSTIQDFKSNILSRCASKVPFIYVADSLDSLSTDEEILREFQLAIARAKSPDELKKIRGSYKAEKAKHLGEALRMINDAIETSNSLLVMLQQERDDFRETNPRAHGKTTSGGHAPIYYSTYRIWMNTGAKIDQTFGNIKRQIGTWAWARVVKNKDTGKKRMAQIRIFDSYGIDDIMPMVNFLCDAHWQKASDQTWNAVEFDITGSKQTILNTIESTPENIRRARQICGKVNNEIETKIEIKRTRIFGVVR